MVEVLPVVLRHQAEQGQEGPAEGVEAGVAVVRVPSYLQTVEAVGALPVKRTQEQRVKAELTMLQEVLELLATVSWVRTQTESERCSGKHNRCFTLSV